MSNGTRWVGIDLHRKRSHIAVIDEQGELTLSRRIINDRETFLELLGDPGRETHVALEATYGWEWLAELLEEAGLLAAEGRAAGPNDLVIAVRAAEGLLDALLAEAEAGLDAGGPAAGGEIGPARPRTGSSGSASRPVGR